MRDFGHSTTLNMRTQPALDLTRVWKNSQLVGVLGTRHESILDDSAVIACSGQAVYQARQREQWVQQLTQSGARRRPDWLYQQLDQLQSLRKAAHQSLLAESRCQRAQRILREIPGLGPTRAALIQAMVETPHRLAILELRGIGLGDS